jgi:hypothetical protein
MVCRLSGSPLIMPRTGQPKNRRSISSEGHIFSAQRVDQPWGPSGLLPNVYWELFRELRRQWSWPLTSTEEPYGHLPYVLWRATRLFIHGVMIVKTDGELEVQFHLLLISVLDGGIWWASSHSKFTLGEWLFGTHVPQECLGAVALTIMRCIKPLLSSRSVNSGRC